MKKAILLILLSPALRAGEVSLYYLNNLAVQYEGTGFRQTPAGWELKVKPQAGGEGLRWRQGLFQFQYWRNNPYFSWEDGNSAGPILRQTGQTRMAVNTAVADIRLPLAGTPVEAVAGLLAAQASFDRKEVVFNGVLGAESATERLGALGPAVGFHGAVQKPLRGSWSLWADGEVLTGHFLWSWNRQKTGGSPISRGGYGYLFRGEAGVKRGPWRLGAGVVRQSYEILVRGGKGFPNGGAASLPINKIDFESPFVSLTWEGL